MKHSSRGSFLKLATSNAAGSGILLAATPFIARVYGPEAFGAASLFSSVLSIAGVVSCLRYETAIATCKSEEDAGRLFALCLIIASLVSGLCLVFLSFFGDALASLNGGNTSIPWMVLLPCGILLHGTLSALEFWSIRKQAYNFVAVARIASQGTYVGSAIGLNALIAMKAAGSLILSTLLGKLVSAVILLSGFRSNTRIAVGSLSRKGLTDVIVRYRKFPIYGTLSIFLGVSAWQLPILALGYFFNSTAVGLYALGFRVLQTPIGLLGNSVGQVFMQRSNQANREGWLPQVIVSLIDKLIFAGLTPALLITLTGRDLFIVIFGEQWAEAGTYAQVLSIWSFFWFLSVPLTSLFATLERQEIQLRWNILNFSVRFIAIGIGSQMGSPMAAIVLLGALGTAVYIYKNLIILRLARVPISSFWVALRVNLIQALPSVACLSLVTLLTTNSLIRLTSFIVLCLLHMARLVPFVYPARSQQI